MPPSTHRIAALFILLLFASLITGCKLGGDVVTYASTSDPLAGTQVPLNMRIARPPITAPSLPDGRHPALILVHGGNWEEGEFDGVGLLMEMVSALNQGYVTATINYRLTDQSNPDGSTRHPWPAQIQDVKCAIRWLKANAGPGVEQYNIDPGRIVVMGVSAGGHLALMAGETAHIAELESPYCPYQGVDSSVAAVVSYVGVGDMSVYWNTEQGKRPLRRLLNSDTPTATDLQAVSPMHYIQPEGVPVLQMHTRDDAVVPCHASERMHHRLLENRRDSHYQVFPEGGHYMIGVRGNMSLLMHQWLDNKIWQRSPAPVAPAEQAGCTVDTNQL